MVKYCPECGEKVREGSKFCGSCGKELIKMSDESNEEISKIKEPESETLLPKLTKIGFKSPMIAAGLAAVLGFFGVLGIGHIYISKLGRGIVLLISGLMLESILWYIPLKFFSSHYLGPSDLMILYLTGIISLSVWVWQTYDAYTLAKNPSLKDAPKTNSSS